MQRFLTSPALLVLCIVAPVDAASFDFNSGTNQGWTRAGFYDNGGLDQIPDAFVSEPAPWSPDYSAPDSPPAPAPPTGHGAIIMGGSGSTPLSPTGDVWVRWDYVSPPLNTDPVWGAPRPFTYAVLGDITSSTGALNFVQTVWHVIKPDMTEAHFTDNLFHPVTHAATDWQEIGVAAYFLPAGTTVIDVSIRVFFEAANQYDGYIAVDNIRPVTLGDMDGDNDVDFDDIQPLLLGLADPNGYEAAFGLPASLKGDLNQDGNLDLDDVAEFVSVLNGATPSGSRYAVPEPSTLLLAACGLFAVPAMGLAGVRLRSRFPEPSALQAFHL